MYYHNKLIWSHKCKYHSLEIWSNMKHFNGHVTRSCIVRWTEGVIINFGKAKRTTKMFSSSFH